MTEQMTPFELVYFHTVYEHLVFEIMQNAIIAGMELEQMKVDIEDEDNLARVTALSEGIDNVMDHLSSVIEQALTGLRLPLSPEEVAAEVQSRAFNKQASLPGLQTGPHLN